MSAEWMTMTASFAKSASVAIASFIFAFQRN